MGRGRLDPLEEKLTATQDREWSSCVLPKESVQVPLCDSRYRAGGGAGEERGERSASPEPLILCTLAPVGVTMTLKVIDFWDQDISQTETQFKKKNRCFTFSGVWLKKEK